MTEPTDIDALVVDLQDALDERRQVMKGGGALYERSIDAIAALSAELRQEREQADPAKDERLARYMAMATPLGYQSALTVVHQMTLMIQAETEARRAGVVDEEPEADIIRIKRPVVPYGPAHMTENQATAHYLREVVHKIESGYTNVGGSNVTRTVKDLLAHVAMTLDRASAKQERADDVR